ncbi:MAG: hydroxyacylglutathione hydrolase [Zetaproteobacteria bacterium CG2_30_46_52]|nr:MAG: hydroxyacylglutathione hydrolase [Zetaproteobacteria bacterium CG2_30_46_52]
MWTYQHSDFLVHQIPALENNYIYVVADKHSDNVLVIDPALAELVRDACKQLNITPSHILNTHHHWDHTDGNAQLVAWYGCEVVGNAADTKRIPHISKTIHAGESFDIGSLHIQSLDATGHTIGHIVYVIDDALFCGDTLFGAGCGRLFEGSFAQMWTTLQSLAALDEQTKIYCAHEYTLANLSFANSVDGNNPELQARIIKDTQTRNMKLPTIPSSIGLEKHTNPMLRALDDDFCSAYNPGKTPLEVFTDIRSKRNVW